MSTNAKVSIEPIVSTSSPTVKKVVKRIVVKSNTVPKTNVKKYADASSGVALEVLNQRILFAGMFVTAITVLATVVLFYFKATLEDRVVSDNEISESVVEEVETVQEIASEIEEKEVTQLEREEITLEILNASGTAGFASDISDEFEDLGYIIDNVGNSEEQVDSELYISEDVDEEELKVLLRDVDRKLNIEEIVESIELDVTARIILGSDQN